MQVGSDFEPLVLPATCLSLYNSGMTEQQAETNVRIILESTMDGDHWYAWRAGNEVETWSGETARDALQNLLTGNSNLVVRLSDLIEDPTLHRDGHIECVPKESASCPDCQGSGKYIGFTVVDECKKCEGTGLHLPTRIDVIKRRNVYRLLFKRYFEQRHDFAVRTFGDVQTYIHQLAVEPDCIICGMESPAEGPIDLLNRLGELDVTSPVIVSTNSLDYEDDLLRLGAFAVLSDRKFGREDYIATVKLAIMSRRESQKGNSSF